MPLKLENRPTTEYIGIHTKDKPGGSLSPHARNIVKKLSAEPQTTRPKRDLLSTLELNELIKRFTGRTPDQETPDPEIPFSRPSTPKDRLPISGLYVDDIIKMEQQFQSPQPEPSPAPEPQRGLKILSRRVKNALRTVMTGRRS